ncbi:5738_t:CDS:1, partial [Funneliformis geosporum]
VQFILTRTFYGNYDSNVDLIYNITNLAEVNFRVRVSLIMIIGYAKLGRYGEIVII